MVALPCPLIVSNVLLLGCPLHTSIVLGMRFQHVESSLFFREILEDELILTEKFSSVGHLCLTHCDLMNRSMPGLPVHHQLPEFTQTPVHQVGDVIQPSHPLLSPSPPAPNPSQHQGLFQ